MAVKQPHSGSHWRKRGFQLGALAALLLGLPGCQSIEVTATNVAEIRVIEASPDPNVPGLDFYLNNTALAFNVGYATISSYIPVVPGGYTISADADKTTKPLVSATATLVNGNSYSAIVGNQLATLSETILQDQTQPAPSGEISLRFVDQASKVGAVDVYLIPTGGTLITTLPFLTNVSFTENTGYLNVPAITYTIAIVPTGTVPIATTLTLYTGSQITYASGAVRTVILVDQQITTTPGLQVIIAKDVD